MGMGKKYGLVSIHADTIDEYMIHNTESMGARHIIERLYDDFKRSPPSRRQVGIYLKLNPNYQLVEHSTHGRLYLYSSVR